MTEIVANFRKFYKSHTLLSSSPVRICIQIHTQRGGRVAPPRSTLAAATFRKKDGENEGAHVFECEDCICENYMVIMVNYDHLW